MSTRSTIVSLDLGEGEQFHIFHDVDGIHIVVETDPYEYKQDIHISNDKWKEVLKQMKGECDYYNKDNLTGLNSWKQMKVSQS